MASLVYCAAADHARPGCHCAAGKATPEISEVKDLDDLTNGVAGGASPDEVPRPPPPTKHR
jgi:hypothetical protein